MDPPPLLREPDNLAATAALQATEPNGPPPPVAEPYCRVRSKSIVCSFSSTFAVKGEAVGSL